MDDAVVLDGFGGCLFHGGVPSLMIDAELTLEQIPVDWLAFRTHQPNVIKEPKHPLEHYATSIW
jgi:hypothetical protein